MTNQIRNLIASLVALAIGVGYLTWASTYPPDERGVPVLVGAITTVLALIDVIANSGTPFGRMVARLVSGRTHLEAESDLRMLPKEWLAALWMAIALVLILLLGFIYAIPVYAFAYMRLQGRLSYPLCLAVAGGTTLFCWGVFEFLLDLPLYRGMLFKG